MKNNFNLGRRKFFSLLAGAAALPLAVKALLNPTEPQEPAADQKHKNGYPVLTMSGRVGIGITSHSAVLHVR